jgi:cytochrome c biogenesis protein CcmG, thiol:disulfide interchange protein DsbE
MNVGPCGSGTPRATTAMLVLVLIGCASPYLLAASAPQIGQPAPALRVEQLDGHTFDLATLRGKVVIVNFWATWCGPCRAEMPMLDAFYRQHHEQGLELLGLSIDEPRDLRDVKKVMSRFSYPAALGKTARDNAFGAPLAVPMTYVIDSGGILRARLLPTGKDGLSEQALAQTVLPLLPAAEKHP